MVSVTSPGKSREEVQDDIGDALTDGLAYDDTADEINVTPANALEIDVNGKVSVVESGIDHGNLSGVTAAQHHAKTTDSSDLTDVSADSVAGAHHSKTSSASELSDVSPDSQADAHHAAYTDSQAQEQALAYSFVGVS